jgi:RHS repeat-associated protein
MTAAGGVSYSYDQNGNQTSRGSDAFAWDQENRLTSATIGGTQTTYTYNGDGLRQTRASGGNTIGYTWDVAGGLPVLLQDGTNTYAYGVGLISVTDGSGNQTYPLKDGLGSTVALVDGSGSVTGTYAYDVFGAVRSQSGTSTEFSFTGEQNDPNGYEYLRARYYDPEVGRFISEDAASAVACDPTSLNRFTYSRNNPVNRSDPSGMADVGAGVMPKSLFFCDQPTLCAIVGGGGVGVVVVIIGIKTIESILDLVESDDPGGPPPNASQTSGGGEPAVTPPNPDPRDLNPVNITAKGLEHATARHSWSSPEWGSKFYDGIDIQGLIEQGRNLMPVGTVGNGGLLVRVVAFDDYIGIDLAGQPTGVLSIITDLDGNLITAYPGYPLEPIIPFP